MYDRLLGKHYKDNNSHLMGTELHMSLLELEQKRPREMDTTVRYIVLPAEGLGGEG